MRSYLFLIACFLLPNSSFADKQVIHIAAIDWCPQICPETDKPGYIIDLVKQIYSDTEYELDIRIYPWSRALSMTQQGRVHAVLSPAKPEAPDLLYPINEVGTQRMCFFTDREKEWQYENIHSLKNKQFGLSTDTSIEELNDYALLNPEQFQYLPYNERHIVQQAKKVLRNRIHAFLFTYNSTVYTLKNAGKWDRFKSAGCVQEANIYMAFSPQINMQDDIKKMMEVFDEKMAILKRGDGISQVMSHYGLDDWRAK
ncbi:hypothetical protein ACMXYW_07890 [Neptuniibacter sp. QD48_55]|uniref:hypothetical protein n=1 Tax=Neptuniibacter sp. QD48_55 TaxID=3398212 RepID=UPI0039F4875C